MTVVSKMIISEIAILIMIAIAAPIGNGDGMNMFNELELDSPQTPVSRRVKLLNLL